MTAAAVTCVKLFALKIHNSSEMERNDGSGEPENDETEEEAKVNEERAIFTSVRRRTMAAPPRTRYIK